MKSFIHIFVGLILTVHAVFGQKCLKPTLFTWEGAQNGNKAVWKVNDTSNTYTADDGVVVKVSLIDPFQQNTTTLNPSEFGDFTKTNTFFGNGSLAFQITSKKSKQPTCLEFEFSKNITLDNFEVWDIDNIAHIPRDRSTYQDSLSVIAFDKFGEVPMFITPMSNRRTYTINGQSVFSGYNPSIDGDLNHRDSTGAVRVSTVRPITKFVLCYANGSRDDGLSNSQAARISSFRYCEYLGNISGQVLVDGSFMPLSDVKVRLLNGDGTTAVDKNNVPITGTTDANGFYRFIDLPLGDYKVAIISPVGYQSSRDIDEINDNTVSVTLDTKNNDIKDRNFYQIAAAPLPVRLVDFRADYLGSGMVDVKWQTSWESNNDFFTIYTSLNGVDYISSAHVSSLGNTTSFNNYSLILNDIKALKHIYVTLEQTDYDGKVVQLGIRKVAITSQNQNFSIWPNPADNLLNIEGSSLTSDLKIEIINTAGLKLTNAAVNVAEGTIDVSNLDHGIYILRLSDESGSHLMRFVKQ